MRSISALLAAMGVAATVTAAAVPASAAVIPVANASFELPVLGPGDLLGGVYNTGPITGWIQGPTAGPDAGGPTGVFNPSLYPPAGYSAPDGNQVAWTNNNYIAQLIGAVTPGMSYTLSVLVGQRLDIGIGEFDLALGTVQGGDPNTFAEFASAGNPPLITPAPGGFVLVSLTGTAPKEATGDLVISLFSGPGQANWDTVSLTSAVPEPATWALMLFGFAAVSLFAWRRTRKTLAVVAVKGA